MDTMTIVFKLLEHIVNLLKVRGDAAREEEILMQAEEDLKAERDRRKFGG